MKGYLTNQIMTFNNMKLIREILFNIGVNDI